jgi:DnaJ-class molecular chaperone
MADHYQTLGVNQNASQDEIKRAYRKLASLYHPDKEGGSKTKFQEVEEAYDR